MEKEYIRVDTKHLTINVFNDLFSSNDFVDKGNDLFTKDELDLFVNNFKLTFQSPMFAAIQNEYGIVEFKTGKLHQFINAILNLDAPTHITRKLKSVVHISFVVVNEEYNKEWTKEELTKSLNFYL